MNIKPSAACFLSFAIVANISGLHQGKISDTVSSMPFAMFAASMYICCLMQPTEYFANGQVLLFNKPYGYTSFGVIKKVRYLSKVKKVGHAGTLDPLATGLLIVCTGKFTKRIQEYMGMEKEYTGTFTIGSTTPSYDLETAPENFMDYAHITPADIQAATLPYTGHFLQMPPQFSAIKKDGKRLYESARQGIEVRVEPRPVTIQCFEITKIELPIIHFRVVCSTGTYIRSLAHDFGKTLGVGAYMSSLCRTRIGDFRLEDAYTLESFERFVQEMSPASPA